MINLNSDSRPFYFTQNWFLSISLINGPMDTISLSGFSPSIFLVMSELTHLNFKCKICVQTWLAKVCMALQTHSGVQNSSLQHPLFAPIWAFQLIIHTVWYRSSSPARRAFSLILAVSSFWSDFLHLLFAWNNSWLKLSSNSLSSLVLTPVVPFGEWFFLPSHSRRVCASFYIAEVCIK